MYGCTYRIYLRVCLGLCFWYYAEMIRTDARARARVCVRSSTENRTWTPNKINGHNFRGIIQRDSKRWTQFHTYVFPELCMVCE